MRCAMCHAGDEGVACMLTDLSLAKVVTNAVIRIADPRSNSSQSSL